MADHDPPHNFHLVSRASRSWWFTICDDSNDLYWPCGCRGFTNLRHVFKHKKKVLEHLSACYSRNLSRGSSSEICWISELEGSVVYIRPIQVDWELMTGRQQREFPRSLAVWWSKNLHISSGRIIRIINNPKDPEGTVSVRAAVEIQRHMWQERLHIYATLLREGFWAHHTRAMWLSTLHHLLFRSIRHYQI